jgi:hypothetical protein
MSKFSIKYTASYGDGPEQHTVIQEANSCSAAFRESIHGGLVPFTATSISVKPYKENHMSFTCKWWHLIVALVLASYPANYSLMKAGVGFYHNDPNYEWTGNCASTAGTVYHGPDQVQRTWCFIGSPVAVPVNLIGWMVNSTLPPQQDHIQLPKR